MPTNFMTPDVNQLIKQIHSVLTPDLLSKRWKNQSHPLEGHCYVAAEALWHLLKKSNWTPFCASYIDENGQKATHWWIKNKKTNKIKDPTKEQYYPDNPPYHLGKPCGFLTNFPSKRAKTVIDRIKRLYSSNG